MSEAVPAVKGEVGIEGPVTPSADEVRTFLEEGEEMLKKTNSCKHVRRYTKLLRMLSMKIHAQKSMPLKFIL